MRTLALAAVALIALTAAAPAQAVRDDHTIAVAAIADVSAAIAEIVRIEDSDAVGHPAFLHAAHRALNALVGRGDPDYVAADGDPGDGAGTIGDIDRLLDRNDTPVWTPALQSAKANALAAAQNLHDALGEKEMEDYEADLTQAMANLALVTGRPSTDGVLGGLSGAVANTSLGIPAGATSVSACGAPANAPAYGVIGGRLAYIALSRAAASTALPAGADVSRVVVKGDTVLLYTHVAPAVAQLCAHARLDRTRAVHRTRAVAAAASGGPSYTTAQARAGAAVYAQNCLSCHGANLQGSSAPAVAGTEFLTTVHGNKWSFADLQNMVTQNMPLSDPGSLTPTQYANVLAFLLASNCYPAGKTPFPSADAPGLAKVKIPGAVHAPGANAKGVCAVK